MQQSHNHFASHIEYENDTVISEITVLIFRITKLLMVTNIQDMGIT